MQSYEVVRRAVEKLGAKAVASKMNLSAALVYKWGQPPADEDHTDASGSRNPLDRVKQMYDLTGDDELIAWLCRQAGGFLVKNPTPKENIDVNVLDTTQLMIWDFSHLLRAVSESIVDGDGISGEEAARIRNEWETLKSHAESFVVACERGHLSVKQRR
jgi:hypothetical protein